MIHFLLLIQLPAVLSFLASGDREFDRINYTQAVALYDSALTFHPGNPATLWRLARAYVALGEVATWQEREELYRRARDFADRCIAADSLVAEGYTWRAAALGNITLFVGKGEKVRIANAIQAALDRALLLRQDDDAPYSILGSFYHALGELSWLERGLAEVLFGDLPPGGFPEAERALRHAIELAPRVPRHRYELGRLYFDWGRKEKATEMFESAMRLPITAAGDTLARKVAIELMGRQ